MRIVFITPEYATSDAPDGGLANYVRNTTRELNQRGVEVAVITLSERSDSWVGHGVRIISVPRIGKTVRWALWHVPVLWGLAPAFEQYMNARRIARAFWRLHRQWPVDLVQASSFAAPGLLLVHNGRVPVVCRASSYTSLLRSAYGRQRTFSDHWTDWFEIRQVAGADAGFAPSELVATAYERLEGCKLQVIRSFAPAPGREFDERFFSDNRPAGPYLLFFGTLSRIKGVDLLADVLAELLEEHPLLSFFFIGRDDGLPGGSRCVDHLKEKAGRHASRVIYLPAVSKPRLLAFVSNALGVVMPSRVDNYPNACLEAQSLGVPVVGASESSLEEMVQDGVTGFLVRNGDSSDLRRAIARLLAMSDAERAGMRRAILDAVAARARADAVGELLAFYRAAISAFRTPQLRGASKQS